jgi:uncharacterized membrane protein
MVNMRRTNLFLILTIASLASLIAVIVAGYYVLSATSSPYPSNWMGQMGSMMGGTAATQAQTNTAAPYFGVAFVALLAVAAVGIGGLIYFFAFPEIRNRPVGAQPAFQTTAAVAPAANGKTVEPVSPYESVLKTLTGDERKVIDALKSHDGKYLQKYIRNETGLSRLQTHRIVARLAERGVVSLEKTGNTNTVSLANWLK